MFHYPFNEFTEKFRRNSYDKKLSLSYQTEEFRKIYYNITMSS